MKEILFVLTLFNCSSMIAQMVEGRIIYKVEVSAEREALMDESVDSLGFTKDKGFVSEEFSTVRESKFVYDKAEGTVLALDAILGRRSFAYDTVVDNNLRPDASSGRVYFETDTTSVKSILGYKCTRVSRDLGDLGRMILWVTDEIDPGMILPNSPLSMNSPALEVLIIKGRSRFRYIATEVSETITDHTVFNEFIPNEYRLTVPTDRYVPGMHFGDTARVDERFDFITYPFYPPGNDRLNALFKMLPKELERPHYLAHYAGFITFSVDKEGNAFEIEVPLTENERMRAAIVEIIEKMRKWVPATVNGQKVNSFVTLQVMFPDKE